MLYISFILKSLTYLGTSWRFYGHKVMLRLRPAHLRCSHGFTRTYSSHLHTCVTAFYSFDFILTVSASLSSLFLASLWWPLQPPFPASAPPPEGRRTIQGSRDSTSTRSGVTSPWVILEYLTEMPVSDNITNNILFTSRHLLIHGRAYYTY